MSKRGKREGRVHAAEQEEELGKLSNWIRPRFSPDGRQVLFATNSDNIWIANTDGSGRRTIATADEVEYEQGARRFVHGAVWHPSGKFIVYDNWHDLFIVNVETGEQQTLEYVDESGEFIDILSQWSPDGTHIVISSGRGNGPELWVVRNLLAAEAAEN